MLNYLHQLCFLLSHCSFRSKRMQDLQSRASEPLSLLPIFSWPAHWNGEETSQPDMQWLCLIHIVLDTLTFMSIHQMNKELVLPPKTSPLLQGFMEYSYLFYGFYNNTEMMNSQLSYNIPMAYLLTTGFYFIFCLICIVLRWVNRPRPCSMKSLPSSPLRHALWRLSHL